MKSAKMSCPLATHYLPLKHSTVNGKISDVLNGKGHDVDLCVIARCTKAAFVILQPESQPKSNVWANWPQQNIAYLL